ncbi:MAG: hypothetical protein JWO07_184 [Candidatus Saccharibacteria bacterium]|nr:hypothetical protein [Candidatus Saccharibacteria bacterium]
MWFLGRILVMTGAVLFLEGMFSVNYGAFVWGCIIGLAGYVLTKLA